VSEFKDIIKLGEVRVRCACNKGKESCWTCKGNAAIDCTQWKEYEKWYEKIDLSRLAGVLGPLIMIEAVSILGWKITSNTNWGTNQMTVALTNASSLLFMMIFLVPIMFAVITIGTYLLYRDSDKEAKQ